MATKSRVKNLFKREVLLHLLIGVWGEWKSSFGTWFRRVVSSCLETVK
jgi:hypothetical protein